MKAITISNADKSAPGTLPDWWPTCLVCNKPVESATVDQILEDCIDDRGQLTKRYVDTVLTLQCHGDTWSASRRRGPLSPSDVRIK